MDLEKLSKDGTSALMTLPQSDLSGKSTASSFMLLQLPEGWKPQDLKESQFVAPNTEKQAVLICNAKHESFYLSNVETSNCLVLVPPSSTAASPSKKAKLTHGDSSSLTPLPTRLLKPGGSGASFLELRPKKMQLAHLRQALAQTVLDPYNTGETIIQGRSVHELTVELQQSQREILQGIQKVPGVYQLDGGYCWLSEEVQLTVYEAILSNLAEVDGCQDYAETGIPNVDSFVQQTLQSMSEEEKFEQAQGVIRHCLLQLAKDGEKEPLRLDVGKVSHVGV